MSTNIDNFSNIIAELDGLLPLGTGDGFWSAREIFTKMDRRFLNGWAMSRLKEILDEKELLVFRDKNSLTINVTKGYAVSLAMITTPSENLFLYPQHYFARNVGRSTVKVRRYRPDRQVHNDVYDPDVRLDLVGDIDLQPDQTLERDGYGDVLDWACADAEGFVLRLHSESLGHYEWAFDRQSLGPMGFTVLDSYSSQVTTVMQMLSTLGAPVDREFVDMGLGSEHFHVRWETLKMVGQIAPELVLETLTRLENDSHPAIRRAVLKTLRMNEPRIG